MGTSTFITVKMYHSENCDFLTKTINYCKIILIRIVKNDNKFQTNLLLSINVIEFFSFDYNIECLWQLLSLWKNCDNSRNIVQSFSSLSFCLVLGLESSFLTWKRCPFVHYIVTFWYLVSIKFYTHSVFIHIWILWR